MPLNKIQLGQIYRPTGPKVVVTGQAWSSGGSYSLAQGIDLSTPIMGIRIQLRGRIAVGTANYTTVNQEGVLQLIRRIQIVGTNSRQGGNVTLVDTDLATAWMFNSIFNPQGNLLVINNVHRPQPGTPLIGTATAGGESSYFLGTTAGSPYDFRFHCDIPFYPHGIAPLFRPGFGVRQSEWANSLQLQITYGTQADNADGCLGVSAATTVTTFSAFGSGTGSMAMDIYALPYIMGLDLTQAVLPGVLSRVNNPITTVLTTTATNVQLGILQPKDTTRVLFKQGTSTTNPYFVTLSDGIATSLGLTVGGNRVVRELDDVWTYKNEQVAERGRQPIIGYNLLDFCQSNSPFSAFPGTQIGGGTLFELKGSITGTTNAFGLICQEQMIYPPQGSLYGD